jgi:DNA-binding LacI/PurR family transcriptional regulator
VTSVDVARRAGVSQSTVSLVLSGKARGRISARTEALVRRTAEELGYRPNVAARALRTGAARTVGLVVPDVTNPVFGRVLRGAQSAAREAGYAVVLLDAANDREWELASLEALRAGHADGVLLFGMDPPPEPLPHAVAIETAPGRLPVVRVDVEAGTYAAAAHLLERGHRRIGHLASAARRSTFVARAGYLADALARAGAPAPVLAHAPFAFEPAAVAARELIAQGCTALFCDDDLLAGGAYLAAREQGVRIPEGLSVVGFDDLDFARVLDPPLTTVGFDAEALGATAFAALAAGLAGDPVPPLQEVPVSLVVRGSTGPPPG